MQRCELHEWNQGVLGPMVVALSIAASLPAASVHNKHTEQGRIGPPDILAPFVPEMLAGGLGSIRALAGPEGTGFDPYLYVVLEDDNKVIAVDGQGDMTLLADLEEVVPGGLPGAPAFDVLGQYGGAMFVNDMIDGWASAVMPDGSMNAYGIQLQPNAIVCDPTGAFGGWMFVVDATGDLYAIRPNGQIELFATDVGARAAITFAADERFGPAMYLADPDGQRILRVEPWHETGAPAPRWEAGVIARVGMGAPASIAISNGGAFGDGVMYVFDEARRRVDMFAADGSMLGQFARDLPQRVTIELPAAGAFRDAMIMTTGEEIWILRRLWDTMGDGNSFGSGERR